MKTTESKKFRVKAVIIECDDESFRRGLFQDAGELTDAYVGESGNLYVDRKTSRPKVPVKIIAFPSDVTSWETSWTMSATPPEQLLGAIDSTE